MIKADSLNDFHPGARFRDGSNVTLDSLRSVISEKADEIGILVSFTTDQIKAGGLFNSSIEDCLVLYHPEHERDYLHFCITARRQGTYAFVEIKCFGESKQLAKANLTEFMRNDREGKGLSYQIGSRIGQGLRTLGGNKAKLEEEQMYYTCLYDIFEEITE